MSRTPYEEGQWLGKYILHVRSEGGDYDPRWEIADEAKRLSREDFKEYMRGLNDVFK